MGSLVVVEKNILAQSIMQAFYAIVAFDINVFVFEGPPESFYEDIVKTPSFSIHADPNVCFLQPLDELLAGILASLVRIEYLGFSGV